jgi:hypothetical protein
MKTYKFDMNARVEFTCDAENEEEAGELFLEAKKEAEEKGKISITVDWECPEIIREDLEEENDINS